MNEFERQTREMINKRNRDQGVVAFEESLNSQKKKDNYGIEDAEIIEEIPNNHPVSERAEEVEVIMEENEHEKVRKMQKDIIQKITEIKIRNLSRDAKEDFDLEKQIDMETFRSRVGEFGFRDIKIPKDHPLMPVLEYAKDILQQAEKGKVKLPTFTIDFSSGRSEKVPWTIESALSKIFGPLYSGDGKLSKKAPETVKDLLMCLEKSSEEYRPDALIPEETKFGKASFDLICSLGDAMKNSKLQDVLSQFEKELI